MKQMKMGGEEEETGSVNGKGGGRGGEQKGVGDARQ